MGLVQKATQHITQGFQSFPPAFPETLHLSQVLKVCFVSPFG